ncbi:MAG: hypothetical protein AAFZ18_38575 [Myxococcota bacterium]
MFSRRWGLLFFIGVAMACSDAGGEEAGLDVGVGSEASPTDAGLADLGGGASGPQPVSVSLTPGGPVQLVERNGTPVRQVFELRARFEDGSESAVFGAQWTIEPETLADMSGSTVVSRGQGGAGRVQVLWRGLTAAADFEVRVERVLSDDPNLPANPEDAFTNPPEPGRAGTWVYPSTETMLPPNLLGLEIHFIPAAADEQLFRLRLQGDQVDVQIYTTCQALGEGCLYELPEEVWRNLADTAGGRGPLTVTVEGSAAGRVSRSEPVTLSVAPVGVEGGLYYWSTSARAILRVDFGAQGDPEQFWPPPGTSGGPCYGCHALAPDGEHMSLSQNGIGDGELTLLEVATQNPLVQPTSAIREQFQSWNPDSNRFAAVYGDGNPPSTEIRIRDGRTAAILETIDLGFEPTHIDWSPTGDRLAFTKVTRHGSSQRPGRGGISVVRREGSGWSAPVDLVDPVDGLNHYTPVISPDGTFLVYAQSACPAGQIYHSSCDADADPTSELFALRFDDTTPIRLSRANAPGAADADGDLSDTFPKWAPFVDPRRRDGTGRLMWFTFSSRRSFGLRRGLGSNKLLWMAALDPDAIAAGRDGSFSAFALPFQDLSTSNHIAQWTRRVVPTEPPDGPQCVARGGACENQDQCCPGLTCDEVRPNVRECQRNF